MDKGGNKSITNDYIIVQVKMRGSSLGIILKPEIIRKYGLEDGDYLKVELHGDGFVCKKIKDVIT